MPAGPQRTAREKISRQNHNRKNPKKPRRVSWHTTFAESLVCYAMPAKAGKYKPALAPTSGPNSRLRLLFLCEGEDNTGRLRAPISAVKTVEQKLADGTNCSCLPAFLPSAEQRYITIVFRTDISFYLAFCQNFQFVLLHPAEIALLS